MKHSSAVASAALASLAALTLLFASPSAHAAGSSISFTAAQATAGGTAYEKDCSSCHGSQLEGGAGPALSGPNFKTLSTKVKANVGDIFTYMTSNMPLNAPASLPHNTYLSILTFILSKNGYHAGSTPLTFAAAQSSKAPIVKE